MSDAALASRLDDKLVCEADPFASEPTSTHSSSTPLFTTAAPNKSVAPRSSSATPLYLRPAPVFGQSLDPGMCLVGPLASQQPPLFLRKSDASEGDQTAGKPSVRVDGPRVGGKPKAPAPGADGAADGSADAKSEKDEAGKAAKGEESKDGVVKKDKQPKAPEGEGSASGEDAKAAEKNGKGPAGAKKKRAGAKAAAEQEATQETVELPAIDTVSPSFGRAPIADAERGEGFRPAAPPSYRITPRAGGKPEPPSPKRAQALALFREAMAQTARLHAAFLDAAQRATASVRATEASLVSAAQGDLDRALSTLRAGLDQARLDLDISADAADGFIELRRQQTYAGINAAESAAQGALDKLKEDADTTFETRQAGRTVKGQEADKERTAVTGAGQKAAKAVSGLKDTIETDFPTDVKPMPSAINEAVGMRMPKRSKDRAQTYTDEQEAQNTLLTGAFKKVTDGLKTQFDTIGTAMEETAKRSAASITKSRDAARKQLAKGAREMHGSVAQARARGHAALVEQHNTLRRQMVGSHRDRAMRENALAQQRAARGSGAALNAAKAQQAGATSLGEALAKEASRPPDDLAKAMSASAGGMLRQLAKSGPEQRDRLDRSVKAGEDDARAQSQALGSKLDRSALDSAEQLRTASRSAASALDQQVQAGVKPFDQIPGQVTAALKSVHPQTKDGYVALNDGTKKKPGAQVLLDIAGEAITNTIAGTGGSSANDQGNSNDGKAADTPDANAKKPKEKPGAFRDRAGVISEKPQSDDGINALITTAKTDIPARVEGKVGPLYDALKATSTPVENVMAQLRGLTKQQGRALSDVYETEKGYNLARHLRSELNKFFSSDYTNQQNIAAALAYLAGDTVKAAKHELNATVYLWNDTGRAEKVMRALTPAQVAELNKKHPDVVADVSGDLSESEKKVFDALKDIKPLENLQGDDLDKQRKENYRLLGIANSHALKRDIDQALETKGEEGGDKAADTVSTAYQAAGSDAISGGDGAYDDPDEAEDRRKAIWKETNDSFKDAAPLLPDGSPNEQAKDGPKLGAIARYAAAARTRTEFVADDGPNGGHFENVTTGLDPRQARLIDDIANTGPNSEDTAASTIEFETNRKEGRPREDRLRKALLGDDLMGAKEGESDEKRKERLERRKDPKDDLVGDEARVKARKQNVLKKVAERRAEGQRTADGKPVQPMKPEEVQKQITAQLDLRFVGDPTGAAYTKSMIESPTFEPDPGAAFDFAIAHEKRNKETLKATTERMNRDQVKAAVAKWDEKHPERSLYSHLGLYGKKGALEGDARNETELAFRGKPRNDKEKALNAIFVVEQQRRDSTSMGRGLASGEFDAMTAKQAKVLGYLGVERDQIDETGDIRLGPDKKEIRGKFDPVTGQLKLSDEQRADFESAMRFSHMNAESYKQAVDRISQGIVMALIVAAAIITTFVTFGGAAAIWGPILITAAAGFAGMAMTAAIRGDRYTSAEIQRDFVMTLVQAATAGLGAGLGAAAKGAGAAGKGAAALEKGAETAAKGASAAGKGASAVEKGAETAAKAAAGGEKLAAGAAGAASKQGLSFGAKALEFGKDVVVGGATNSINSFAAAAMDPENRRQGKALDKGIQGGVKGFLSGSLGAAVTKPFSALGRPFGKGAERMAGNVGSGFTQRLAEARIGQAMGDPHQSWAESIEMAKEGIAQDIIQAGGEHAAEGLAARRAARKAAARTPTRTDEPHTGTPRPAGEGSHPEAPPRRTAEGSDEDAVARAKAVQDALPPDVRPVADETAARTRPPAANDNEPGALPGRRAVGDEDFAPPPLLRDEPTTAPHPRSEEPGPSARRRSDEELELRTAGHDDDDVPSNQRKTGEFPAVQRTLQDHFDDPDPRPPPIFVTADITADMLKGRPSIPRYSEFTASNPHSPDAARANYEALRGADPHREVLLARCVDPNHPDYGQYKVFQGGEHSVSRPPEGWITERHSHPWLITGDQAAMLTRSLPSGKGADFDVLRREVDMMAGLVNSTKATRESKIDIRLGDSHHETTFSVTRDGDKYEYRFSVHPPINGVGERGPFRSLDGYEKWAQQETKQQFAKGGETYGALQGAGGATPKRAVHGEPITPPMRQDLDFIAGRMALTGEVGGPATGARPHTELDNAITRAAAMSDARQRIVSMGLVGEPDSMIRLHNILNDDTIPVQTRAMISDLTLAETRNHLLRTGELKPGEPLIMLFHGATPERTQSMVTKGIDMTRGPGGPHDDFGQGLYFTKSFETALKYRDTRSSSGGGGDAGGVIPYMLRGRDIASSIDVSSRGDMRAKWEAFAVANAQMLVGGDMMMTPVVQKILMGKVTSFAEFDASLHQNRGTLFNEFLASVGAKPSVIFGDLGGPLTHGIQLREVTDQVVIRGKEVADILNKQHVRIGAGDADALEMRMAGRPEPTAEPAAPRRREVDPAVDRMVERAIVDPSPPAKEPKATAPKPLISREGWQMVVATIRGFQSRTDALGKSLNTLMTLAPKETGRILLGIAADSFSGRQTVLKDAHVDAIVAEAMGRGATREQARALVMDLLRVASPQSPMHQALSEAPFGAGFDQGLQQRLDAAFTERQASRVAREYADRDSPTASRRELRRLLDNDPEGVMQAILAPGTPAERAAAYYRARRAAGVGVEDAFNDMRALRNALSDPGYARSERRWQDRRDATNMTAAHLADLVRQRPDELLHLARTNPDQLAEYFADFVLRQLPGDNFAGPPTADQLARYIAARQRSNVLPVASETSSIWANLKRMGLHLLKADAVSRGGANRPGLDIVGFRVPPGSRVSRGDLVDVVIMDDKAFYSRTELESVSAMTGDRLPTNLRASANEIEADIARLRNLGEDIVDERIANHIAGAEAAVTQMRRAADELDAIRPASRERMRDDAYLQQVADVLARNRIVPAISREYGNIRTLAQWLIAQGFVFDDEDALRLAKAIERRRGRP